MALSAAKKASNAKWDKANMATIGARLRRTQAEKFKEYCAGLGLAPNRVLQDFILSCIGEIRTGEENPGAGECVSANAENPNACPWFGNAFCTTQEIGSKTINI